MTENFNKLTELQNKVGYKEGPPNTVAILGLFGEAGEVLNEGIFINPSVPNLAFFSEDQGKAINIAECIDALKKRIRDNKTLISFFSITNPEAYDKELADVLYYLNALAINRGKTLDYYAGLSVQKVLLKSATDISHGSINKETYVPEKLASITPNDEANN